MTSKIYLAVDRKLQQIKHFNDFSLRRAASRINETLLGLQVAGDWRDISVQALIGHRTLILDRLSVRVALIGGSLGILPTTWRHVSRASQNQPTQQRRHLPETIEIKTTIIVLRCPCAWAIYCKLRLRLWKSEQYTHMLIKSSSSRPRKYGNDHQFSSK